MTNLDTYLKHRPDRCNVCGAHAPTQGHTPTCTATPTDEWSIFKAAIRQATRADGRIHQCDVRPIVRGRVEAKHVGQFYRRAKAERLITDTGDREPSNDVAGRNQDKLDRVYAAVANTKEAA